MGFAGHWRAPLIADLLSSVGRETDGDCSRKNIRTVLVNSSNLLW
jgi:hypothetical protein